MKQNRFNKSVEKDITEMWEENEFTYVSWRYYPFYVVVAERIYSHHPFSLESRRALALDAILFSPVLLPAVAWAY